MNLSIYRQNGPTCGANAYRTLLSAFKIYLSEKEAVKEVKTKASGTSEYNVHKALLKRGIEFVSVNLFVDFFSYKRYLYLNSLNRILYLSLNGSNKGKRGRPTNEHHAIIVHEGMVYDSAVGRVMPIEAYVEKYNHKFLIKSMIVVDSPEFKLHIDEVESEFYYD